jgi:uncharacterized protein YuzE
VSTFRPYATHDPEADAIYVYLLDEKIVRTKSVDDLRNIDYSRDGAVVGVELLGVGGGIDLSDIPYRETVEKLIGELGLGIKIFA